MGLRIRTNVPSLVAQRHLQSTRNALDKTYERISSGSRINRSGDDAAGLANSELLRAQIRGLNQAERNAQDGISVVQIAEGGLSEISNILIRLRELSVQAASDTIGQEERKFINIEFQQLTDEIDRIANTTEFNRVPLLNGKANEFDIQVGTGNNPQLDRIRLFEINSASVNISALGISLTAVDNKTNAQLALGSIDSAIELVIALRSQFGAVQNRLQSTINNIMISKENLSTANSRIRDADLAEETTEMAKNQILMQSGISVLSQSNASMKAVLSLLSSGGN